MARRAQSPLVEEMLAWSEQFESGQLRDPRWAGASLAPGERFAVRVAPVVRARFLTGTPELRLDEVGSTGVLVATDRRMVFSADGGDEKEEEWTWADDIGEVTAVRLGLGAMWTPSPARYDQGVRMEGVVLPAFAAGRPAPVEETQAMLPVFLRIRVAWMASQPAGVEGWRQEFLAKYGTG